MADEFVNKGLGRRIAPDDRDKQYPMAAALRPTSLPQQRYYTVAKTLPFDQGETSTCVAHAWTEFLLCAPLMCKNAPNPFDLYRKLVLEDEFPDNDHEATLADALLEFGSSVRGGVKALQKMGYIRSYVWARAADEMAVWLLSGKGTIVVGTDWTLDMGHVDEKGFARPTGMIIGGHAYLIIGYSRIMKAFRCLNSWGRDYGSNGRFWIAHEDMHRLIRTNGGEACAAIEQIVPPQES